jgi:peptidoglycan hydrolase CwlO-like protein
MAPVRRLALVAVAVCLLGMLTTSSSADLMGRYQSGVQQSSQLGSKIKSESNQIQGYEGNIRSLQARLSAVDRSVAIQEGLLHTTQSQLASARTRLAQLRALYARDLAALATQLRADYETPAPNVVGVVVDAHGFDQLLNGLSDLRAIELRNTQTVNQVRAVRVQVTRQTEQLSRVEARRQRATAAVVGERDTIAQLKLSIVDRELTAERARSRDRARLTRLRGQLAHEAHILDERAAAAAQSAAGSGGVPPTAGCVNTPFVPHGGEYGFFPAAGTNYTVNEEPVIAARLDELGKALQLHLIGVSGYRSPQHSVEVGGFADDPHTKGLASDTPGVEGVPESTLERFCLTRPFPGAREADHIQES